MALNHYMCNESGCSGKAGYEQGEHFGKIEKKVAIKNVALIHY